MERARLLELALRQKGWTRAQLAEKTGYDSKTIRNLLSGQDVRPQTGYDICQALGVQPINVHQPEDNIAVSSEIFGGYLRSTHAEYEGSYYLYRPSFTLHGQVFRSIITIYWDIDSNKLSFKEYYGYDDGSTSEIDAHSGNLYISTLTGLTHFLIIDRGSIRLMTMTKLRQSDKTMRGILMTQSEDFNFFMPTVTPIVLRLAKNYVPENIANDIKILDGDDSDIVFAKEQLRLAEEKICKLKFGIFVN